MSHYRTKTQAGKNIRMTREPIKSKKAPKSKPVSPKLTRAKAKREPVERSEAEPRSIAEQNRDAAELVEQAGWDQEAKEMIQSLDELSQPPKPDYVIHQAPSAQELERESIRLGIKSEGIIKRIKRFLRQLGN